MIKISEIPKKEIIKGFEAQFIHTEHTTLGIWEVKKGAILPMHNHFHEQITQVLEGQFELTIGENTAIFENGDLAVIPSNIIHGGRALTDCKIFDIFSPVREDYKI
ncbi:MAG: cupin domain-containing protein [Bacteroidia bacterium]|jgi:quercetin dioxygenase-like cupin family protein|nr:cupin domain-containing protein [uncultured Flavobacterium sp.]MBP6757329.1 cupin domain-containing protein [Bacteroidia bacterium]